MKRGQYLGLESRYHHSHCICRDADLERSRSLPHQCVVGCFCCYSMFLHRQHKEMEWLGTGAQESIDISARPRSITSD